MTSTLLNGEHRKDGLRDILHYALCSCVGQSSSAFSELAIPFRGFL